jgi:hypothetical protein
MVTILPALRQVREDLAGLLERTQVERICRELGYTWRERQLDPYTTLHLFILQVVNQNTAMTHLPHLAGERFTASAYCQARQRLPLELIQRLVDSFASGIERQDALSLWHGHRLALIDGSGFSMPDTPELQAYFGQPGGQRPGCGFPVGHLLALMDAHAGFLHDVIISPLRTHDMKHAADLHPKLCPGDIVVGDRAFCSYAHLALILRADLHAVLRVHQKQIVSFHPHRPCMRDLPKGNTGIPTSRWVERLGHCDQLVKWARPQSPPKWMTQEDFDRLPEEILVREIKCRIHDKGCRVQEVTLVTTLLDPQRYPAGEIAELYRLRWQEEVDLRDLKITLGLDVLKGHKVETVKKEALIFSLVYNMIRLVAAKAARRQRVRPHRISFIDALRWLQPAKPEAPLPDLVINPIRPGRIEPRCIKRRGKKFPLMKVPRHELRKRLQKRRDAA